MKDKITNLFVRFCATIITIGALFIIIILYPFKWILRG